MPNWNFRARSGRPAGSPGTDGRPGPLATSGGANQARVPQGRKGPSALSAGRDAADSLCATLLQSQRPRRGGPALRGRIGAPVRWSETGRGPASRPPFSISGKGAWERAQEINAHLESQGPAQGGNHRGRQYHRRLPGNGTRRCIRRRKGTSGISG